MSRPPWMDRRVNPLSEQELDDLIRDAYAHDLCCPPDRFDEIQARVVAAEDRRAWWPAYFAGRIPGLGEASGCRGVVVGALLSLPLWAVVILLGRLWGWW